MINYFQHLSWHFDPADLLVFSKGCYWNYLPESRLHAAQVPETLISSDLIAIRNKFHGRAFLFKFPAYTFYQWHKDRTRKCAINYELTTGDSTTYFGLQDGNNYKQLVKLEYHSRLVLMDTTQNHCIANLDTDRIIFTLGIYDYSYSQVLDHLNMPSPSR